MKKIMLFCALFFTVLFIQDLSAQTNKDNFPITRKYTYTYTFENASSEDAIQKAQSEITTLLHVTEVKYKIKQENNSGELIITVIEKDRTSESEELFSPYMIKSTLIKNGISPLQFEVSQEIVK